jgi:hypothetical protein
MTVIELMVKKGMKYETACEFIKFKSIPRKVIFAQYFICRDTPKELRDEIYLGCVPFEYMPSTSIDEYIKVFYKGEI